VHSEQGVEEWKCPEEEKIPQSKLISKEASVNDVEHNFGKTQLLVGKPRLIDVLEERKGAAVEFPARLEKEMAANEVVDANDLYQD